MSGGELAQPRALPQELAHKHSNSKAIRKLATMNACCLKEPASSEEKNHYSRTECRATLLHKELESKPKLQNVNIDVF